MKLHFEKKAIQAAYDFECAHCPSPAPYADDDIAQSGLLLVGDQGVYIMPNTSENTKVPGQPTMQHVVYAKEADPALDDWWESKRESFGPEDGAEFLPIKEVREWLALRADYKYVEADITPTQIEFCLSTEA